MKPIEARTIKQICSLRRDHLDTRDFWLWVDEGEVIIAQQRNGKRLEASMDIPRAQFDKLVLWYVTGSLRRPSTTRAREGKE